MEEILHRTAPQYIDQPLFRLAGAIRVSDPHMVFALPHALDLATLASLYSVGFAKGLGNFEQAIGRQDRGHGLMLWPNCGTVNGLSRMDTACEKSTTRTAARRFATNRLR